MSQRNNIYLVKSLAPWMVDELIAFSKITPYKLLLLREQDEFYANAISKLKENGVEVLIKPYSYNNFFKKLVIIIKFMLGNIIKFQPNYNGVIGGKSLLYFLKLDTTLFNEESSLHAQFATQPAIVSLLLKKFFNNKLEYSFTYHAHDIYFNNKWLKQLIKNSFKVFSISDYNIKYLKDNYDIVSDKVALSRLGVFRKNVAIKKSNKEPLVIGVMSWFTEKKGIIYLLKALKELKDKTAIKFSLVLAGDGPQKEEYFDYINANNLKSNVNYLGKINNDQKEDFFESIEVFALPSITLSNDKDGIPVVLMEAVANAIPIISTNVSGIPEICIDNYNGFLVEEKNVEQLFEAFVKFNEIKQVKSQLSEQALISSNDYDIEINSENKIKQLNWI